VNPTLPPPSIASHRRNQSPRIHGPPEPRRCEALKRAARNTRRERRDEATAGSPSAGDAPRAPVALEPDPPATTGTAARSMDLLHSPAFH